MNDGLIPQRYAKALFKFAQEKGNTAQVYAEMQNVERAFADNPDLSRVLANPFVARADKENLLVAAAGDKIEDDFRSFITLILDQKREAFAREMALAYCELYRRSNKIARVKITTASKLDDALYDKLRNLVQKAYEGMTLEFENVIDPDIIGGFIIDVDSSRLDASMSNELEQLRHNLLSK